MAANKESCNSVEHECLHKCNSRKHGSNLTAALTKSNLSDEKVAAYIKWCCIRYPNVWDLNGRKLIHMAASTGRLKLLNFLLKHKGVNINEKDKESNYTPLHCSLFNGQIHCGVRLIEQGANIQQRDFEDLTPIDHVMVDRPSILRYDDCKPCEVYVWGTNTNYTLGIGKHKSRSSPEPLEIFRRQGISIKQVVMSKFHSAFISSDGRVWVCGHGQGGRLGLEDELTILSPKPLKIGNSHKCTFVDLGMDHTVFLMANHSVLSCGLNNYHQLGHSPPPNKILSPTIIKSLQNVQIIGISASRYHSAFWSDSQLFTCGLNGGQLGHPKGSDSTIIIPKVVPSLNLKHSRILIVSSSDGAIVVATTKEEIFLLYEYQCRKIMSRSRAIIPKRICVIGGHLDHKSSVGQLQEKGGDELKILIISNYNIIYLWQESTNQAFRCELSLHRNILISDVALNKNAFLFTTKDGEAFEGEIKIRKRKVLPENEKLNSRRRGNESFSNEECEYIKLKRIPHIHRGVKVTSDLKGRNFAITQVHPKVALFQIPKVVSSEMKENMKNLYESIEQYDPLHDVTFEVEGHRFSAHRYIVAFSSSVLEEMIKNGEHLDGITTVKIQNVSAQIFRRILCFIYTRDCDLLHARAYPINLDIGVKEKKIYRKTDPTVSEISDGIIDFDSISAFEYYNKKKLISKDSVTLKEKDNPLKLLKSAAEKFDLIDLQKKLETLRFDNGYIFRTKDKFFYLNNPKFNQKSLEYLCDITLKSADEIEIKAHKCILVSRLEYFDCMINQGWLESTQKTAIKLPIPGKVLNVLINYLYTDEAPDVVNTEDIDLVIMTLIVADQFFCSRLKEYAEFTLANLISLKNAAEILQIASMYNADQLKQCSMEFICLNLPAILELRSMEILHDSVLKELSDFYRSWLPCFKKRQISNYFNAPDENLVDMIYKTEPVSLNTIDGNVSTKLIQKTVKKKSKEKRNNELERTRNTSTGSITSEDEPEPLPILDFSDLIDKEKEEEEEEAWVKVVNHSSKHQKNNNVKVRTPVDSSKLALQSVQQEKFVSLNKLPVNEIKNNVQTLEKSFSLLSADLEKDFPALNSSPPERAFNPHPPSPGPSQEVFKKFVKLSQKQRKRLANQSMSEDEETPKNSEITMQSPWRVTKIVSPLLTDIMKEESKTNHTPGRNSSSIAPSSPWQDIIKPVLNLSTVMAFERKQREQFARMKSKPLEYTQMEDRAMEDLLFLYNAYEVTDERITVRRAEYNCLPAPVWVSSRK